MKTTQKMLAVPLAVVATLSGAVACSSDDPAEPGGTGSTSSDQTVSTTEGAARPTESVSIELSDTGAEVSAPMDVHPLGDSLLVAERSGRVVELTDDGDGGYETAGTVVDLTDAVGSTDAEKGLLGVTTDPDGSHLYVNHTRSGDGATVILQMPLGGEPGNLTAGDQRELLVIDQPFANHNGGDIEWGPDDMLWIGTGDGGAADDPDGRAQRLSDPLGKILRLDPSLEGSGSDLAPSDNPYADGTDGAGGDADPLVWARGVRNPWRISFDPPTGDLWIADVGQNEVEEITVLRADEGLGRGADLGWDLREGDREFADPGPSDGWPTDDAPVLEPLFTYSHDEGCSISGGFVYHGTAVPQLSDTYLFTDYCFSDLQSLSQNGSVEPLELAGESVVSINPDQFGEPLVLDATGISRIVPT